MTASIWRLGSVLEFRAAVEYNPWKHVGISLGFDALGVKLEADGEDWPSVDFKGNVEFNYTGLQLYLRYFLGIGLNNLLFFLRLIDSHTIKTTLVDFS